MKVGVEGKARIVVLTTDPNDYSSKKMYRFDGYDQVTSSLSVDGVGSATVTFSNVNMRYMRGIGWPKWATEKADEISILKSVAQEFAYHSSDRLLDGMADMYNLDQLVYPWLNAQDFIWIDYLGRDGVWYPGFSGIVTGYKETHRARGTSVLTISAKDYRRMLQYSPIVTGINLPAQSDGVLQEFSTIQTDVQSGAADKTNIFAGRDSVGVLSEVVKTVNKIWNIEGESYKGFFRYYGSGTAQDLILFEDPVAASATEHFTILGKRMTKAPKDQEYYNTPLARSYYDPAFSNQNSAIYQLILRSQLSNYAVDMATAHAILGQIAQATMSYMYIDQLGNLRHEAPRYGGFPSTDTAIDAVDSDGVPFHGKNYFISSRDASYLDYSGGEDESEVVATRVTSPVAIYSLSARVSENLQNMRLTGISNASEEDMLRYGRRDATVQPFFMKKDLGKEVLDAYAEAARIMLNSKSRMFTVNLRQRPDLLLNRTVVYVDRARVGLITDINDVCNPKTGHTRTLTCRYARLVGQPLRYPFESILRGGA